MISHQRNADMGAAYEILVALADERGLPLGEAARLIVQAAQHGDS